MRYPKFLPDGGTIGFIAPSFGCTQEPYLSSFENAQNKFRQIGYKVLVGANCLADCGTGISNTPRKCAGEFMGTYTVNENDVLISVGGGELMCEILPYINFKEIAKAEPKWFMGYSDNTNLVYTLVTMCDVASIYGPCASTFGQTNWHESLFDSIGLLTGQRSNLNGYEMWEYTKAKSPEDPLASFNLDTKKELITYIGRERIDFANDMKVVNFSGRLIGGCLDCLVTLCGTKFDKTTDFIENYSDDGFIWCLEACDLNVFGMRRAMWQLEQAGWFKYCKGFLIGRPFMYNQPLMGLDQYGAILEVAGKFGVPVIMDFDLGHYAPAMPLVFGSMAEVSVKGNAIKVDMSYIE